MMRITDLETHVDRLPANVRERFHRMFDVRTVVGQLVLPASMQEWIEHHFGSVDVVRTQRIVKVTNKVTWEGALFNGLRSRRPVEAQASQEILEALIDSGNDPFCTPLEYTPEDVFGRIHGRHAVTASNVAKYDALHGVVVFERHNPFVFTEDEVVDYVETALKWGQQAHAQEPAARYLFFMWNCSWKAGASILHGHAQVALTQGMHFARVEELRRDSLAYTRQYRENYFVDLYRVHEALGLGFRWRDVGVISHLTPVKDGETLLISEEMSTDLRRALYRVLRTLVKHRHLASFNVVLYMPPIADVAEEWSHFPTIFRIVSRGDPMHLTTDIGAMELYGMPVVGTDPFFVADGLREAFA